MFCFGICIPLMYLELPRDKNEMKSQKAVCYLLGFFCKIYSLVPRVFSAFKMAGGCEEDPDEEQVT